ncbi:hypothetical protein LWI29_031791 [Acer saccharum]|uniref:Uncharacterized protein n=1 Tax=Acer saccharum TaxID=4024 RepID=A0AA39SQP0_ACESA|nr:hypothetical protein LWI29_031791 [Acer saccharum]
MASTNSNSKSRPTLPRNRPTTLIDMMHFVSNWFDYEEILVDEITKSENIAKIEEDFTKYEVGVSKTEEIVVSKNECDNEIIEANKNEEDGRLLCDCEEIWVDENAESERINKTVSELSKNKTSDDAFYDALGDRVVEFGNSIQEKLVDCFDVVKIEEGNDKLESSIFGNFTQLEAKALDVGVVMKIDIEPTNPVDEETKTVKLQLEELTIETVFENFVSMSHVLVGQMVSTLGVGFENFKSKRLPYYKLTPSMHPTSSNLVIIDPFPSVLPDDECTSTLNVQDLTTAGTRPPITQVYSYCSRQSSELPPDISPPESEIPPNSSMDVDPPSLSLCRNPIRARRPPARYALQLSFSFQITCHS